MQWMSAFVSKFLVLTSAVLLALPQGWCCPSLIQKSPVKPAPSCCHHQEEQSPPNQEPSHPVQKCGCEKDLTPLGNPEKSSPDLGLSFAAAVPVVQATDDESARDSNFDFSWPAPPLHVLNSASGAANLPSLVAFWA
jgi:hypothetical protein